MEWQYNEDKKRIVLGQPPRQRLRITGHRIASVLGLNKYQSSFGAWCEITKLVRLPFEDTKYTIFGKTVEPKLIEYVSKFYPNVKSIEDYYGNIFEDYRWNNFKDDSDIFGGIIDAVSTRNDMKTIAMICECKTSSHPEQWANNNVPLDYLLQGALYSYLKGLDRVLFACTFPTELDYAHPENYEITDKNTILVIKHLKDILIPIDGHYLTIEEVMDLAEEWWHSYIDTGISPEFDESTDKEYLKIIRDSKPSNDNDLLDLCKEATNLSATIETLKENSGLNALEKQFKILKENIKEVMIKDNLTKVSEWHISKKESTVFNTEMFAKENPKLYNKYMITKTSYTLSQKKESNNDEKND